MAAVMISNNQMQYPFGSQSNQAIGRLISLNATMARLAEAIATASAGYTGTEGTEFEYGNIDQKDNPPNLFGIQANPPTPGAQGTVYRYAMEQLTSQWKVFWEAAQPYVEQLDNGTMTM
jgi:hypothetical protein